MLLKSSVSSSNWPTSDGSEFRGVFEITKDFNFFSCPICGGKVTILVLLKSNASSSNNWPISEGSEFRGVFEITKDFNFFSCPICGGKVTILVLLKSSVSSSNWPTSDGSEF